MCAPIYLNRTLTYMKHRMSRSHKSRVTFKVNSILDRVNSSQKQKAPTILPRYMNISFLAFYDNELDSNITAAEVETFLLKICYKKRKDSSSQLMQVSLGSTEVVTNPSDYDLPSLVPAISISSDAFMLSCGSSVKSHILILRVCCSKSSSVDDEPLSKRRKSVQNSSNRIFEDPKIYGAELVIYDKQNRCLLSDGDYEIYLQEVISNNKLVFKNPTTWENASGLGNAVDFEPVLSPSIKLRLTWSYEPFVQFVERPIPYVVGENKENLPVVVNNIKTQKERLQIIYQFVYNNNSRQQTEACEDLNCPWCSLNCNALYTLLKHLKLCHSRFNFTYVPIAHGARIDVTINELYDGSYTGSPHDLIIQPNICAFSRNGPVRRASITHILVCHPKRTSKPSLSEFLEQEDCDYDSQRPYITGHNRLYHHTNTCLSIYPKEMDVDSEGENDPEWLQTKTKMMIDEFTDVNEGEKELMKMWNLHVMKYGFVGDCQIPLACSTFVQHRGEELLLKNLYRNFVVHLCSLFDFGLLSAVSLYQTMQKLQELVGETGLIRTVLRQSREAQMTNWIRTASTPVQTKEKPDNSKTPIARKTTNMGLQRRKATPSTSTESSTRRKPFADEVHRKRLSVALTKSEQKMTIS